MADIGIGIIGSGFMGRTYSETIAKYCKGAALRAVSGGSRAEKLAADYGMALEPSTEALLARDDVTAVFITSPHDRHAEQAIATAGAGKHILLEKPMACSVADCDAIIDACEKNGVKCTIAFSQRTRKTPRKAKGLIDEGAIGRIQQMHTTALVPIGLSGLPKWQTDPENMGTLFAHGVHNLDMIRWFTDQEIATVYAKCGTIEPGIETEGTSMVLLTLADGTSASFWCSFQVPKPSFDRAQFSARLIGEKGLMDLDAYGELRLATDGQWQTIETQEPIDWAGKGFLDPVRMEAYQLQCQDFIDAVANDRPPAVSARDGRQAVAAALAAYESSETSREITLE